MQAWETALWLIRLNMPPTFQFGHSLHYTVWQKYLNYNNTENHGYKLWSSFKWLFCLLRFCVCWPLIICKNTWHVLYPMRVKLLYFLPIKPDLKFAMRNFSRACGRLHVFVQFWLVYCVVCSIAVLRPNSVSTNQNLLSRFPAFSPSHWPEMNSLERKNKLCTLLPALVDNYSW